MNQPHRKSQKSRIVLSSLAVALAGAMSAVPTAVQAGTAAATVNASATVNSQCNVQTSTLTMAFGEVDVLAENGSASAPAKLTVQCNKGAQVSVKADNGGNFAAGRKRLKNNGNSDTLAYSILQPTGAQFNTCPASINAGVELTSTALDVKSLWTSSGGPKDITLCGRLETPQVDASPGAYSDTVTVTITY